MVFRMLSPLLVLYCLCGPVYAIDPVLHPYILSSNVRGDMVKTVIELKEALSAGGFQMLGEYSPDTDRYVLVVTNDHLKQLAAKEKGALFTLPQRVGITRFEGKLQVSYTNPVYQKYAFRIDGDLESVRLQLKRILGEQDVFGSKGMAPATLASYRYSYGMEQFDDFLVLGRFNSQSEAIKTVQRGVADSRGGIAMVFRFDLPGMAISLFGISLTEGPGSDRAVITAWDNRPLKHTARFPYTLVVRQGEIFALHPRFKLPLDFPDLERTGKHSFTAAIQVPGGIEKSLRALLDGS